MPELWTFDDMSTRDISMRFLWSIPWAFALCTLVWILWGYFTPGDFFANGSRLVLPIVASGAIIGLITGFRGGQRWRIFVLAVALASLCFWVFAPDGWRAHEPRRFRRTRSLHATPDSALSSASRVTSLAPACVSSIVGSKKSNDG